MKRILFISNPVAGKLGSRTAMFDVIEEFCKKGFEVTVAITQYRSHATELAKTASERGFDYVVCAGGDGTVKEAICGIMQQENKIPLGYIPCGTTNDFANTVGLSLIPAHAAAAITKEKPISIDVGRFNDTNFAYVASFGAFTAISYSVPQDLKNAIGYPAYLLEGLKDITNIKPYKMKLTTNEQEFEGEFIFGCVSNSTCVAGGILHPDKVDISDGLFELLLTRKPENAMDFNRIIAGVMSRDYSSDIFVYTKTNHICFDMDKPIPWSLDGEKNEGAKHIEITNLNAALKLLK